MDYINSNYITLQDLEDVDSKIASLADEKNSLLQQIAAKSLGESHQEHSTEEIPLLVLQLMERVSEISPETSLDTLETLISENGSLNVLTRIQSLLRSRQSLADKCSLLKEATALEAEISQLSENSKISEFVKISSKTSQFDADELVFEALKTTFGKAIDEKRESLSTKLSSILSSIKWLLPKEKVTIQSEKFSEISTLFQQLIELQACAGVPPYPEVCWGLEILLHPFTVRFNYHFRDASETNKLTKPEWALNYAEEFLRESLPTLEFVVGDTFLKYERIGVFEIISAVLVPVREKLRNMVAVINHNILASTEDEKATDQFGRLLSHLIFEATSFDQRIRNTYKYNPFIEDLDKAPDRKWMGLTGDVLLSKDKEDVTVNNWLNLELRLAKKRFDTEIMSPQNALDIDYEFTASADSPESLVKPTYSAYGLAKLFDNLTAHFNTINIVKYQLKFVSQIQLVFLDQYLDHLSKEFRQFNETLGLKLISSFLPSSAKSDSSSSTQTVVTNGLTGLEILTSIYCLAKFVIEKMEAWSENLIYIQLWNYCQSTNDEAGESIFDTPIAEYKTLLSKVANKYEDFFRKEVRNALRDYVNTSNWNVADSQTKVVVSSSLSNFTTTIPAYASYLRRTLPEIDYFLVSSRICDSYAYVLLEYVITNNQFNERGLEQLRTDIDFLHGILKDDLMLDHLYKYSNAENKNYKKVNQSIEMMSRFDASGARLLKKQFQNGESVRRQFENRLDCLSDSECLDLLFRIV